LFVHIFYPYIYVKFLDTVLLYESSFGFQYNRGENSLELRVQS